jgi:N-methylhydantoinase A/oxoprolinase/acetone carboxylase beta subunit
VRPPDLSLGVVAGATTTGAVIVDERGGLVAKARAPTTPDVRGGLRAAIATLLAADAVEPARVTRAMLGAGHATRAALERGALTRVGVVRIGAPLTGAVPPLATWPAALRRTTSAGEVVVGGGSEYDGRRYAELDEEAVARFLDRLGADVGAVAITGVFAPVAPEQELAAAEVVRRELGGAVHLSLSHQIGTVGLLERENATVLNAALTGAAHALAGTLSEALAEATIDAEPYLAQNDGTLMALEYAQRFPVLMAGSGPANSMGGAAYLSGVVDAVVVDAGGGSTHVGALVNGVPREAPPPHELGGVRVGFRLPDVRRLAGGGDSEPALDAVALAASVEWVRGDLRSPPLVVVGGAAALAAERLDGVGDVIRPPDGEVAGPVGAAIAAVSGRADRICPDRPDPRARALEEARAAARARAVQAGADPDAVHVVEVEEIPLTYLVDPAIRISVKAAGRPDAAPAS